MTPASLAIAPEHLGIVRNVLRTHLPPDTKIWAFGSRVTGSAKPFSDLDLAIDTGRRLTLDESAALAEAFSESDLPWKVDTVDLHAAADRFWRLIENQSVFLTMGD